MDDEGVHKPANPRILTINGGSSSIKFALFEAGDSLRRILESAIERIGLPEAENSYRQKIKKYSFPTRAQERGFMEHSNHLVRSNPLDVMAILKLSQATYRKMIQNLFGHGYNAFAIPLAAGALYAWGVLLSLALCAISEVNPNYRPMS